MAERDAGWRSTGQFGDRPLRDACRWAAWFVPLLWLLSYRELTFGGNAFLRAAAMASSIPLSIAIMAFFFWVRQRLTRDLS